MHEGKAVTRAVVIGTAWQQVVDISDNRVALIFSVPGTGTVYLSFGNPGEYGLSAGKGHPISSSNSPYRVDAFLELRNVRGPVFASASATNTVLIVTEVFVGDACRAGLNSRS